jgi:hypothetical protein
VIWWIVPGDFYRASKTLDKPVFVNINEVEKVCRCSHDETSDKRTKPIRNLPCYPSLTTSTNPKLLPLASKSRPTHFSQAVELTHNNQILYEQDYSRIDSPGLPQHALLVSRLAPRSVVPEPVLACSTSPRLPIANPLVSPLQSAQLWNVEWNSELNAVFFVRCKQLHSGEYISVVTCIVHVPTIPLRISTCHFFALMSPIIISKLFPSGCKSMYSSSTPCRALRPHPVRSGIVRNKPYS